MNNKFAEFVETFWNDVAIEGLAEFIRIPAISPLYDQKWQEHGYLASAAKLFVDWAGAQNLQGLTAEVVQLPGKTPLVFVEVEGNTEQTTLFYGHLDKMPGMADQGWDANKGPWQPVAENDRLYGRGSVDNGYAFFTFIAALKLLQQHNIPHPRCVVAIEACEESGGDDLEFYIEHLEQRIGSPDLIMCLDVGGHDYKRIWCINSLRGVIDGKLQVSVLKEAVHSGIGSGIVADSFRILRQLLDRIEDHESGKVLLKSAHVVIPDEMCANAKDLAAFLQDNIYKEMPLLPGVMPVSNNIEELILNSTWRPMLSVIGAEGLPGEDDAANVVRPATSLYLSLRIPPNCEPDAVVTELKQTLEQNPPYGAKVEFTFASPSHGWSSSKMDTWLQDAVGVASKHYFGQEPIYGMEGGSIGVIAMLGKKYPQAQFFVSGLLSVPGANEHAPNESLYIPAAKKMTCCVAEILRKQCEHSAD